MQSKRFQKTLSLLMAFALVFSMIAVAQPMHADAATTTSVTATFVSGSSSEWRIRLNTTLAGERYKFNAIIDGTEREISAKNAGNGLLILYAGDFARYVSGGAVPSESFVIPANTVIQQVDPNASGWPVLADAESYTVTKALNVGYVNSAWSVVVPNTNVTASFVSGSSSEWRIRLNTTLAGERYKLNAIIDGTEREISAKNAGNGLLILYAGDFARYVSGGAVPSESFVIPANTVIQQVDPNASGWPVIADVDTYTVTQELNVVNTDGVWAEKVIEPEVTEPEVTEPAVIPTTNVTLGFRGVSGDGTWQFNSSVTPANKYYKVPVIIDGNPYNILAGMSGSILCIYPNFMTALGAPAPTSTFVIEAGTVLKAADSTNNWAEVVGAATLTVTEKIDLSYVNGVWSKTVYNQDVTLNFNGISPDGTWQFSPSVTPANSFYKVPVIIDGTQYNILAGMSGSVLCIYPNFMTALGAPAPTSTFVIEAGTVLKAADSANNWAEISDAETLTVTEEINLSNVNGTWGVTVDTTPVNISLIAVVADGTWQLNVSPIPEQKYYKIPALIDGTQYNILAGMTVLDGVNILCIYPNFFTALGGKTPTASLVIPQGTVFKAADPDNNWAEIADTTAYALETEFALYVNCDGSWDATADTHAYNQQNTELEGALASAATCQSPAAYYYSCTCGAVGTQTFTAGELGGHDFVNGTCSVCGTVTSDITLALKAVTSDGTWVLTPDLAPQNQYYKLAVVVDGQNCNILMAYNSAEGMVIYPNFFTALGGAAPQQTVVFPQGSVLVPVAASSWTEIDGAQTLTVTKELKVDNTVGTWADMSLYANTEIVDISSADLDVYYQHYLDAADYSDAEVNMVKDQYADLFDTYGRNGNMTTVGIKCTNANIAIPNDAKWANFKVLGTVTAEGASDQTPQDIYILMTPASGSSESTAMTSAFLIRCYNGNVGEQAASITIHEGTIIISNDGTKGFRFTEDFVILRDGENWSKRGATITSANLELGGILNLNIKATNAAGATLRATIGTDVQSITAVNGIYTVKLPAHRMYEAVTLELLNGDSVLTTETWTMNTYAATLRETHAEDGKLMTLLDSLLDYGTYAAYYANPTGAAPAVETVEAVTKADLAAYKLNIVTKDESNLQPKASLYLDDACDLRVKLNPEAFEGYKLWIDGTEVTTTTVEDKIYYEITEILPQDWTKVYNIKVEGEEEDDQWGVIFSLEDESNGGLDVVGVGKIFECNYSIMSYAYTALGLVNEAQTGLNGLLKAMFLYSQAANDYLAG